MATHETGKLVRLRDIDQTVANADEDVRGRDVKDRVGEDIGKIDDLLIDESTSRVRFLVVASGGFLGIGTDKSFIPVDAIIEIAASTVTIGQTREHVANAPVYDPDLVDDTSFYEGVYGYYGYAPFWGAGFIDSGYPNYPDRRHL